jgi:hypothetical protein
MRRKLRLKTGMGVIVLLLLGFMVGKWCAISPPEHISGPRYLIINADDFGLTDGVTEGIVQSWHEGVTTSTSAMINIEGAPKRIAMMHARYPDLPIGLHLNITQGHPVSPPKKVSTLVDANGEFYSRNAIIEHLPEISLDELRAELHAQAELFIASVGRFDHIDYHHHMLALYTPFYPVVRELAREYAVPVRQPVPESVYSQINLPTGGGTAVAIRQMIHFVFRHPVLARQLMPHMMPSAFKEQAALLDRENVPTPNWFIDAYFGNASVDNFILMLRQLPPGVSEVMVHPGKMDNELAASGGGYAEQRQVELEVLLSPRIKEGLRTYNVRLVDFSFVRAR